MARLHLCELEDQKWFPLRIRNYMTGLLNFQITLFQIYDPIIAILDEALKCAKTTTIVDLCSGGGGAAYRIQCLLSKRYGRDVKMTLSDIYPNTHAIQRIAHLKDDRINYLAQPIDATKVPKNMQGLRTLFTSFHHFKEQNGQDILRNAVKNNAGIAIFELSERSLRGILLSLSSFLAVFLLTPFIRPFCLRRLFFTYVIPLVPFAYVFDGIVSQLRSYTVAELLALAQSIGDDGYEWRAGQISHHFLPIKITYLVGVKKELAAHLN